jgi:hypothetical protein
VPQARDEAVSPPPIDDGADCSDADPSPSKPGRVPGVRLAVLR